MKVTYEIELKPFTVPNFVIPIGKVGHREDGLKFVEGIPLKDIPLKTLQQMCKEFTSSVIIKAGYQTEKDGE